MKRRTVDLRDTSVKSCTVDLRDTSMKRCTVDLRGHICEEMYCKLTGTHL